MQRLVVERLEDRGEDLFDITEIDGPTNHLVERRRQVQTQRVRVPVDATQRAAVRRMLQTKRAVERELFPDPIVSAIEVGAARAGFIDRDLRQLRKHRRNALPEPAGQQVTRRVLQARQIVQTGVIQLLVKARPHRAEAVVIDAQVARAKILVGMNDDLEAMAMHATAFVACGDVGQPVRGLKDVATPDMGLSHCVEVDPFVRGALNADLLDTGNVQMLPNPAGQVFVGGLLYLVIEQAVVEPGDLGLQRTAQPIHLAARKPRPPGRQCAAQRGQEAVTVQSARAVAHRQKVDMACRLEAG